MLKTGVAIHLTYMTLLYDISHIRYRYVMLIFTVFNSDFKEIGGSWETARTISSYLSTHQQAVC